MSCVTRQPTLRSLSLSYQKKDWRAGPCQSFFWHDTDFKILSVKAADYKFTVGVIPNEGLAGQNNDNDKDLRVGFLGTHLTL